MDQDATATQVFDVDLTSNVTATTTANEEGTAFNQSRFRTIEALSNNASAQAIFASGQRQGSAASPFQQVAVADGGDASNTLTQAANIDQANLMNTVDLRGTINLARNESFLTNRSANLLSSFMNDSAINSASSSQEQDLGQSAAGGVDESGSVTENGGTAINAAASSQSNTEETLVINSVSVNI